MAIAVENLLEEKARKFGANKSSIDFQQIVVDSTNYVLDDIENITGQTTNRITSYSSTVDLAQQLWQGTLSYGLDLYINDQGEWMIQPTSMSWDRYYDKIKTAYMRYLKTLDLKSKFGDVDDTD